MKKQNKIPGWLKTLGQYLLVAAGLALMAAVLLRLFPNLIAVLKTGDVVQIEDYLRSSNRLVCVGALALMSVLQVASIVIPALPIRIAAGAVLDSIPGFFVCWGGFILANICVFELLRHVGGKLHDTVRHFIENSKTAAPLRKLMDTDNSALFVAIANIIPFLPNGIVPYAAAMTDVRLRDFVVAIALGSALPALADCTLGDAILSGNWLLAALSYAALFALAFALYKTRHKAAQWVDKITRKNK